jgi:DNA-binding CsgD family transcriptional regulator
MTLVVDEAVSQKRPMSLVALTPRELEVLHLISSGVTNAEAARRLQISIHAVKFHLAAIYSRLGVSNRTEAAVAYLRSTGGDAGSGSTGA